MTKERREQLLRAGRTEAGEHFHCTAEVDPWDFERMSIPVLNWGELRKLLAVNRTCSACRWLRERKSCHSSEPERMLLCLNPDSAAVELADSVIKRWGCHIWEQVETQTKGA